ncbi:hypothetical protein ALC62_08492 [Cyphomyrmex costatus]|uniref:Uncharacterized protein n=1 Tax=Cyphomyrmex costatus TaxID=456900 RepID=A0A195CL50_9HYME|nr:hypothetical protein ALC62_08492 [Cyphomyrmex costatus]
MSAAYASRFEAVFLCTHPKGSKMSYAAARRYMKKSEGFVRRGLPPACCFSCSPACLPVTWRTTSLTLSLSLSLSLYPYIAMALSLPEIRDRF